MSTGTAVTKKLGLQRRKRLCVILDILFSAMHQLNDCILPYFLASLLLFIGLFLSLSHAIMSTSLLLFLPSQYILQCKNEGVQNDAWLNGYIMMCRADVHVAG